MKYDEMTKEEQKEKFCKENGSYLYYFKKDDMELVSKKLYDEMVIIIPDSETTCEVIPSNNIEDNNESNSLVNINTASLDELLTLTGVGESKAKAIIEYRN